jgi:hypothetical protein
VATFKAKQFAAPKFMAGDGCGTFFTDTAAVATAPAVNDTVEFAIPAGSEVTLLEIQSDDLDSNGTPTITFKAGYKPTSAETTLVANDSYFGTGLAISRTGGRLALSFKPIYFAEPVSIFLTFTAVAATFAAGEIVAIAGANCIGAK